MTDTSQPLFLFGVGFCAQALARIWAGPKSGTYRSQEGFNNLSGSEIEGVSVADEAGLAQAIQGAHVLISAPPREGGCPGADTIGAFAAQAESVTYLSTTGVYGDLGGGWAMEWSELNPNSDRARYRVVAEQAWRRLRPDMRSVRLPGIYGPGRSPLERVAAGKAQRIVKPGQVFSRAHVDDIAAGLKAMILSGEPGVFHICDEEAAAPQDVTLFAAELLGLDPPPEIPFEMAQLSDMARSFYSECKRVSNARLKAATGWRPAYPTYRQGLTALAGK